MSRVFSSIFSRLFLATALVMPFLAFALPAQASVDESAVMFESINDERQSIGLELLEEDPQLNDVAQSWALQMSEDGEMSHNPNYSKQIPSGWEASGENVAYGYPDGATTVANWMQSESHRENILGDYTHVGTGWVMDDMGTSWAVQVFAKYPVGGIGEPVKNEGGSQPASSDPVETSQGVSGSHSKSNASESSTTTTTTEIPETETSSSKKRSAEPGDMIVTIKDDDVDSAYLSLLVVSWLLAAVVVLLSVVCFVHFRIIKGRTPILSNRTSSSHPEQSLTKMVQDITAKNRESVLEKHTNLFLDDK